MSKVCAWEHYVGQCRMQRPLGFYSELDEKLLPGLEQENYTIGLRLLKDTGAAVWRVIRDRKRSLTLVGAVAPRISQWLTSGVWDPVGGLPGQELRGGIARLWFCIRTR